MAVQKFELSKPDNARECFERAGALLDQNRQFEAIDWLARGVALDPNPICLFRLADLELQFNDPSAALGYALQGLKKDRTDPMGHVIAAKSLIALGRADESERHWHSAVWLAKPDDEQVRLIRARYLVQIGDFEGGLAAFSDIAQAYPDRSAAFSALAMNQRVNQADGWLQTNLNRLAGTESLTRRDLVALRYALGKSYDDLGLYGEALLHFDAANELCYKPGFELAAYAADIDLRKNVLDRESVERLKGSATDSALPIFVVGMIRSGTTLTEQILASHPMVAGAGEQQFWLAADNRLNDRSNRQIDETVLSESASQYLRLLTRFADGRPHVVDKQPGNMLLAGALHAAFPNARIVYMTRDPADTAISIWTTHMRTSAPFSHNKANIAAAIREHERLLEHWQTVLPPDRFMTMSYEALVTDRESSTRKLIAFCGLPWDEACLHPENTRSPIKTPSQWQARQPVYQSSIGRWKNYNP